MRLHILHARVEKRKVAQHRNRMTDGPTPSRGGELIVIFLERKDGASLVAWGLFILNVEQPRAGARIYIATVIR